MKKLTYLLASILFAVACTANAEPPKPLLWKVSDADNSLYLLGSFHLLKDTDYPLADDVEKAFADAEKVVFEISPQELSDKTAAGMKMMQAAVRTDGKTLKDIVPAQTYTRLEKYASDRQMPLAAMQSFEPWFVGMTLILLETQRFGLNPEIGLDRYFIDRASKASKPGQGLETLDAQVAIFDEMGADLQLASLNDSLDNIEKMQSEIEKLHTAWRNGDADGLFNGMAAEMKTKYPALYKRINTDRNDAWLPQLEKMLAQGKDNDALVVVGALHLLGSEGVVEKLRKKGFTVERICSACQ